MSEKPDALVCDANILIDYLTVDSELISLVSRELITLRIPIPVLAEVRNWSQEEAEAAGLIVEDVPLEYLLSENKLTGCSAQDSSCFYLARDKGWGCATNEKALKKHCAASEIPVIRGMRLILMLVENGTIPKSRAKNAGQKIFQSNNRISETVFRDFLEELELL